MTALDTLDRGKAERFNRHDIVTVGADDKSRAIALATGHMLALDAAAAETDYPVALEMLRHYRGKVQQYLRWLSGGDCEGLTALGMLGPNGYGPGIEAACRSARYHGFVWRERRESLFGSRTQGEG